MLFSLAVIYLLFSSNPYLYSHIELRAALLSGEQGDLQTIPSKPDTSAKLGGATFLSRYNWERTATDPLGSGRSKNLIEYEHHKVNHGIEGFDVQNLSSDDSGFFVSGKMPWVAAIGFDGQPIWKYRFLSVPEDRSILPVLLDGENAYLIHPEGHIASLKKRSGAVNWLLSLGQEVIAPPFIWGQSLAIPVKGPSGVAFRMIDRHTGQAEKVKVNLEIKPNFQLSFHEELRVLIAAYDNKVLAIDPETWGVAWAQSLTEPVRGPAVIAEQSVFITTLAGKLIKMDGRRGKIDWEIDLEHPPASSPSYLPALQRLVFLDAGNGLVTVEAKTGKIFWRNTLENRNPLVETWSARLKANHIEEFGMDWLHKGWTIWSPCSDRKFCIFTPVKGQLIARLDLSGAPMALPTSADRKLVFFTQLKDGEYGVSQVLELSEIKKMKLEAQAKAQGGAASIGAGAADPNGGKPETKTQ